MIDAMLCMSLIETVYLDYWWASTQAAGATPVEKHLVQDVEQLHATMHRYET
jgi:hypothetical protein